MTPAEFLKLLETELERPCTTCEGKGGEQERGKWYRCHKCGGSGIMPTEAGERILRLVRHHLPEMLDNMTD